MKDLYSVSSLTPNDGYLSDVADCSVPSYVCGCLENHPNTVFTLLHALVLGTGFIYYHFVIMTFLLKVT